MVETPAKAQKNKAVLPKKRFLNFRSFFVVAISMILSILAMRLNFLFRPLGFILLAVLIVLLLVLLSFYFVKNAPLFKQITCVVAIVLSVAAGLHFYYTLDRREYANYSFPVVITGTVDDINLLNETILLSHIRFNGTAYQGKALLYADFTTDIDLRNLSVGDRFAAEGIVRQNPVLRLDGSLNARAFRSDIRYRVFDFENHVFDPATPNIFGRMRVRMKDTLVFAMGRENAAVAFGMLTGDRSGIEYTLREAYSDSGLAHILAVSGLHIGFLSLILLGFFKLIKVKKTPASLITLAVIFLYAFFVGFPPSVIRAMIMASVMILSHMVGRRYDSLSALSLAVVIILIIFPVYLFDFGFLFSMTAVLGIILFMRPIQNFFLKCKFPKRAADSAALSISAQIGLAPAFTLGMRSVRLYSIPFNILIMPIVGFTFIALLISLLLTMLFSPLGILLSLSGVLVAFLNTAAFSVALLPFAIIPSFDLLGGLIFLSLPLFFSASRFIMVEKKRLKAAKISVCLLTATAIIFVGIPLVQNPQSEVFIVSVAHTRREVTSVVKIDNRVYVLGDVASFRRIDTTLGQLGIRRIDAIILFELDEENARAIAELSRRFRIGRIYLYEYGFNTAFGLQILIESNVRNVFKFCGEKSISSNIFPVVVGQNLVAFEMASMHGSVLFAPFNGNLALVPQAVIDRTFTFRAHRFCGNFRDRIFLTNTTITFTDIPPPLRQYSTSELGRFLFDVNYGRLYALPQR